MGSPEKWKKKIAKFTWTEECFISYVMWCLSSVKNHVCLWQNKGKTWSLFCADLWLHWFVLNRGTKSLHCLFRKWQCPLWHPSAAQTNWGLPLSQLKRKLSYPTCSYFHWWLVIIVFYIFSVCLSTRNYLWTEPTGSPGWGMVCYWFP